MPLQAILDSAEALPQVSPEEVALYEQHMDRLVEQVDQTLEGHASLSEMLGGGTLAMMKDNHANHAALMKTVMRLHIPGLLARLLPWVFRTYRNHGFAYSYFAAEIKAWQSVLTWQFGAENVKGLLAWYEWLADQVARAEEIAQFTEAMPAPAEDPLREVRERFISSLLSGDYNACLTIAQEQTATNRQQEQFYLSVIQPTMYRIGHLWENGEISVAQEHLCASMVGRIMAVIYDPPAKHARTPKAVVTCAWNEFHELGAWIVADMLAMNGWDVSYLGANTPNNELLDMLSKVRPQLLAISVAMPYNLDRVKDLMDSIHATDALAGVHTIVGGYAFQWMPDLWKYLGADDFAASPVDAIENTRPLLGE